MTSIQAHNLFKINQKLFYESLKCKQKDNDAPNPTTTIVFWSNIWTEEESQNEKTTQLDEKKTLK